MSVRGPADTPPSPHEAKPEDGPVEAAALRARRESAEGPVSLAEQRRQREVAEAAAAPEAARNQAKLLKMDAKQNNPAGHAPRHPNVDGDGFGPPAAAPGKARPAQPANPAKAAPQPNAQPAPQPNPPHLPRPTVSARARGRHWLVLISFVLLVVTPTAIAAWYMWERASPRYASGVGFSVRTEDAGATSAMLGGLMALGAGTSSSSDTDILYRYIQSQEIVRTLDARLDLRSLWAKGDPDRDPIFAYAPPGTIEDLHDYWSRMVTVYNDTTTGLLDLEVQAFTPEDAQRIAEAIYEESQTLINRLSDIAVDDTTRLAREELDIAVERLKVAREALTRFRNVNQIVDPTVSLQSQMGLLSSLEEQLAQTLIDLDLLRQNTSDSDPRIQQALARVDVIQARMAEERAKLGLGRDGDASQSGQSGAFANLFGEYERLLVDQEFAQHAYVAALAAYDSAQAEGRQQTRYLAAHVEPTMAERAEYPQRWTMTFLTGLFAFLTWMMLTLAAYAFKDRR